MADQTTAPTKGQDAGKAQERKRRSEPAPEHTGAPAAESIPFAGLLGDSAMDLPVERHAALLGDPRFSHSANAAQRARMVSQLQRTYGNAYAQRVVECVQTRRDEEPAAYVEQATADEKLSGQLLEPKARSEMGAANHYEFGDVRTQTYSAAFGLARERDAETSTTGSEVEQKVKASGQAAASMLSESERAVQLAPKGGAKEFYYAFVLKPMMQGLWDQLHRKVREHRHHLLALACLAKAAGPGGDPIEVARFCERYEAVKKMPVVGRVISYLENTLKIPQAVTLGVTLIAAMLPVLKKIRLQQATLLALDRSIVPAADTTFVGSILETAKSPKEVTEATKQKALEVSKLKDDLERYAAEMQRIEAELGVGKGASGPRRK